MKKKEASHTQEKIEEKIVRPKTIRGFRIPEWWDCEWRRVPCNKKSCKLCGKLQRERERHIAAGEDPDDPEVFMHDIEKSLEETKVMIEREMKRMGVAIEEIDIEEEKRDDLFLKKLKSHPLQKKVMKWAHAVHDIFHRAMDTNTLWLGTEAAANLNWYSPLLAVKTARQLSNNEEIKQGDDETREVAETDHEYIRYVMKECIHILEASLNELALYASLQKSELSLALMTLRALKKQLLEL